MNIPNFFTAIRIFIVPFLIYAVLKDNYTEGLLLFIIAIFSDGLDGFIARRFNMKTVFGSYLDPIADKTLIISMLAILFVKGSLNAFFFYLFLFKDLYVVSGILFLILIGKRIQINPIFWGKLTTFLQMLIILVLLLVNLSPVYGYYLKAFCNLLYILALLGVILSLLFYTKIGLAILKR